MGGFLSLYDQTDRVELGGGYYVDIKHNLSRRETARARAALVSNRIESTVVGAAPGKDGTIQSTAMTVDQEAYNTEILVAAIATWNLTDEGGNALPLPPYIPGRVGGPDEANRVRRESIERLPDRAINRLLMQIRANEQDEAKADEQAAAFPGDGEGAPPAS